MSTVFIFVSALVTRRMLPAFSNNSLWSCLQTREPITTLSAGHERPISDDGRQRRLQVPNSAPPTDRAALMLTTVSKEFGGGCSWLRVISCILWASLGVLLYDDDDDAVYSRTRVPPTIEV
eukprot:256716-Rhodomonas_salina.1